ncbi:MAG: hypothetical protein QGG24_05800 [Vicinamibacterales bacterium]|jgi:hypothetical protein|nr:hypothetical protein [Vicinamibacterales bacterium]MDP7471201.1 hypothetical protein [Vicinamibacterales bacterium]MDP7670892.1 hypothetical protein [Vicinamibacterales bacterium]HJO39637.1 hypothetical protein [Vicinamibacterales bacterium]|tara:strand:- start:878 stop:1018 length:141 start_codon:yes stop_codon:yes gene_type:complete
MPGIKIVNPSTLADPKGYNHGTSVPADGQLLEPGARVEIEGVALIS